MLGRKIIFVALVVVFAIDFLIYVSAELTPQKFLKLSLMRSSVDVVRYAQVSLEKTIDPRQAISAIPFKRGRFVDVLPERRYSKSIIDGRGDCSNLSYGFAYWLIEQQIDFTILHLLRMPAFTEGDGHVALETAINFEGNNSSAVLDLLEGGVLTDGTRIISSRDLFLRKHDEIEIMPFHTSRDTRSAYYKKSNLENTRFGFTPKQEIAEYYDFIESIYVYLGHRVLERYIFDGIALVLDLHPKIYVHDEDFQEINDVHRTALMASQALLWLIRLTLIVALALLAHIIFYAISMKWVKQSRPV